MFNELIESITLDKLSDSGMVSEDIVGGFQCAARLWTLFFVLPEKEEHLSNMIAHQEGWFA